MNSSGNLGNSAFSGFGCRDTRLYSAVAAVAISYLVCAVLVGLADIFFVFRHYTPYPFGDHWVWLARLYELGPFRALLSQYNEHRLTVPGIFYLLDHRYLGSANRLLIVASMLMEVGCIVLLAASFWHSDAPKPIRHTFTGFVVVVMLWFIQAPNFFYPFSLCMACCNVGILASFYCFSRLREGGPPRSNTWLLAGVFACALWASFSYGHGILIWPVLLVMSRVRRLPTRWWYSIWVGFACTVAIYAYHYRTPAAHGRPWESLLHPFHVGRYILLMLGLPFFGADAQNVSFFNNVASYALSVIGIVLALLALWRFIATPAMHKEKPQIVFVSVILLTLGSVFITAVNRSHFPLAQALSSRYAPVPLLFWISLVALVALELSRLEVNGGLGRLLFCAFLMIESAVTLPTQLHAGPAMALRERRQSAVAMSVGFGIPDLSNMKQELYPDPAEISFVDGNAKRVLKRSLFALPEAALLGSPLSSHFRVAPPKTCEGIVDAVHLLPAGSDGAELVGWAWDVQRRHAAKRVWVTDGRSIIRGAGVTEVLRLDVSTAYGNGDMSFTGWLAYSQFPTEGPGPLTVFAELADGQSVCQIGTPRIPGP